MTPSSLRRFARYLPLLIGGRPLRGQDRHRPFFLVGSGRCGSTLLRAMLAAHPDLHIPPERALGSVRTAQAFGARYPAQYLEVRYEDLVREPQATIRAVATFLGVAVDEHMLRHHELDLRLGDVDRYPRLQGVRQPVHQASIGRWRTAFNAGQIAELDRLLGPTLAALGYDAGEAPGAPAPRGATR